MAKASQQIKITKHKDGKARPILIRKNSGIITVTKEKNGYITVAKFNRYGYMISEETYKKEGDTD